MKTFVKEFKQFISRGNVVDLAVGIVIGAAFGKIVSSLVKDILMPPIGLIIGGVDFTDLKIVLREAINDPATGKVLKEAVSLNYGMFVQTLFDFIIIAFAVFLVIKGMNRIYRKKQAEEPPKEPSQTEKLLTEIRDLLKDKKEQN